MMGNYDEASAAAAHANVAAGTADAMTQFWVLHLAFNLAANSDPEELPAAVAALAAHADRYGAPWMLGLVDQFRGILALEQGDAFSALQTNQNAFAVSRSTRSLQNMTSAAAGIVIALLADLEAEPTAEVAEMLALIRDTRYWTQLPWACEAVANYFARRGALETAAVIAGVLQRHRPFGSFGARQRTETLELVAPLPNVDTLMARAAAMSPTDALDFAIEHVEQLIHKQD